MGAMHRRRVVIRIPMRAALSLTLLLLTELLGLQQALAFEGDYIWEERFKAALVKAASGQAKDQYAVGDMYFRGRGTAVDSTKALRWFLLAAQQGHIKAAYKAGYLYLHGDNNLAAEASPKQALPWLNKAAQSGYAPAQYELGRLYFTDDIVKRDEPLALKWLGRAKAAGYAPARSVFDKMVKHLVKEQKNVSERDRATKVEAVARNLKTAAPDLPDPRSIILRSKWGSNEGPSTLLPSRLTHCRASQQGIECLSAKLDMQLASTHVVYRTRARISDISPDGQFRLAYANNVLSTDDKTADEAAAVKAGWQRTEHVLDCSLMAGRTISCAQGTSKQYRFFGHY